VHEEFAAELARFKDKEACIVFPTGYSANVGFISALMRSGDTIFLDQYSHASIVDGASSPSPRPSSSATTTPRPRAQDRKEKGKKLVVVEGVYSMDGDMCALPEILEVTKRHGRGCSSTRPTPRSCSAPTGAGWPSTSASTRSGLPPRDLLEEPRRPGGFVAGTRDLIDYVVAFGRSRFFSCNLSPVLTRPPRRLRIAASEPQLRAKLWSNVAFLRRRFAERGRHRQVQLAGHAGDGEQRREGVRVAEKIQDRASS